MVASLNENGNTNTSDVAQRQEDSVSTNSTRSCSSFTSEISPSDVPPLRRPFANKGLSGQALSLIMSSWRPSTQRQYKPYLQRWEQYCRAREIDSVSGTVVHGVNFLAELYQGGVGYSAVNTARSALSAAMILPSGEKFGSHQLVARFMKGVFEKRPSLPRYTETWKVDNVLQYLANLGSPGDVNLKTLTYKLVMLLALLSGQRRQTLHALDIGSMQLTLDSCTFVITSLLKTSRPGKHLPPVKFVEYKLDKNLCIIKHIKEYLRRTKLLRGEQSKLLISYQRPYQAVSADTISRWLKIVLDLAGIDTSKFGAHSTRSAATSAAKAMNMPIEIIMHNAGWSQESTFAKYYHMPVVNTENFGNTLLQNLH